MKRDQLNDTYLDLIEKQRLYFKTVKDFKEVSTFINELSCLRKSIWTRTCFFVTIAYAFNFLVYCW